MPCPRIIFQACAARFKCFWLCLVLAQLYDPHRPLMQRKTNVVKQMGIRVLFSKRFCCCRTSNMSRHRSMQCAWACIKYRNAISYWSEVRHAWYVYECKTLSLRELVPPALLDPSAWFLLGSHAQRYEFLVMRLAAHVYTGTWCGQCVNYCPRNLEMKGYYMKIC